MSDIPFLGLENLGSLAALLSGFTAFGGSVIGAAFFIWRYFTKKNEEAMKKFSGEITSIVQTQNTKLDTNNQELKKDIHELAESNKENSIAINKAADLLTKTIIDVAQKTSHHESRLDSLESKFMFFYDYVMGKDKNIKGYNQNDPRNNTKVDRLKQDLKD